MFDIYKYEYENGLASKEDLLEAVPMYGLSEVEYHEIVGDQDETAKTTEVQA